MRPAQDVLANWLSPSNTCGLKPRRAAGHQLKTKQAGGMPRPTSTAAQLRRPTALASTLGYSPLSDNCYYGKNVPTALISLDNPGLSAGKCECVSLARADMRRCVRHTRLLLHQCLALFRPWWLTSRFRRLLFLGLPSR
jgi:hypothetical protein